jgi:PIN domain nuclease of toxin-antitoxin system
VPSPDAGNLARKLGFEVVPILEEHVVTELWEAPPTNDPFDRLLLAVAQVEGLKLVTLDRALLGHPLAFKF